MRQSTPTCQTEQAHVRLFSLAGRGTLAQLSTRLPTGIALTPAIVAISNLRHSVYLICNLSNLIWYQVVVLPPITYV